MVFLKFFFNFFFSIFYQNRNFLNVFVLFMGWFINLLSITNGSNTKNINFIRFELEKDIFTKNIFFYFLDILVIFFTKCGVYNTGNKVFSFKIKNLKNNKFYFFNNNVSNINNNQVFLYGLRSIWRHLRL
jgi:hypothetical protein